MLNFKNFYILAIFTGFILLDLKLKFCIITKFTFFSKYTGNIQENKNSENIYRLHTMPYKAGFELHKNAYQRRETDK